MGLDSGNSILGLFVTLQVSVSTCSFLDTKVDNQHSHDLPRPSSLSAMRQAQLAVRVFACMCDHMRGFSSKTSLLEPFDLFFGNTTRLLINLLVCSVYFFMLLFNSVLHAVV